MKQVLSVIAEDRGVRVEVLSEPTLCQGDQVCIVRTRATFERDDNANKFRGDILDAFSPETLRSDDCCE